VSDVEARGDNGTCEDSGVGLDDVGVSGFGVRLDDAGVIGSGVRLDDVGVRGWCWFVEVVVKRFNFSGGAG
jgi:hypothetical protein